jgi:hypothetical protein
MAQRCDNAKFLKDHWQACCPAHDDTTPSLSITPTAETVLIYCHAGCTLEAITAALGMTPADLYPTNATPRTNSKSRIAAVYDYVDADGNLMHQTVRFTPKKFRQRRPNPSQPGAYLWNLKDITLVLYHLPDVLQAVQRGDTIYVAEGEKDVETPCAMGLVATCNPMGAKYWKSSYSETLRGAHAIILPDNDKAGEECVAKLTRSLAGVVASLKVIRLPELPLKGDVTDWVQAGGTRAQLEALVALAVPDMTQSPGQGPAGGVTRQPEPDEPWPTPPGQPTKTHNRDEVTMDTVVPAQVEWLWWPYLSLGNLAMLDGEPGVGKSLLTLTIAAVLSRGWNLPDQQGKLTMSTGSPSHTLLLSAEDSLTNTMRPRLESAEADCSKVVALVG